jgi:hypothetical protein
LISTQKRPPLIHSFDPYAKTLIHCTQKRSLTKLSHAKTLVGLKTPTFEAHTNVLQCL